MMSGMTLTALRRTLRQAASPGGREAAARFIKTGPGEYGAGDQFLGVCVPDLRRLVPTAETLPPEDLTALIHSPFHEERLLGFLVLVRQFEEGNLRRQEKIFYRYLHETPYLNGWDLVDSSAPKIVGAWILQVPQDGLTLTRLAKSPRLWERRMAIVSTVTLIRAGQFDPTLTLSKILLHDPEDLIHKAVGWMLREVGKRDPGQLRGFLCQHADTMPRTMLRYAIEKFPAEERRRWREAKPRIHSESRADSQPTGPP